jgi:tetratricopeptide (TPR) repeat protein
VASLGNIYRDLHDYEKARDLLEKGLIFREKYYGKDHFNTAKGLRDLGLLYILENDLKTAENFLKKSLTIFHKTKHVEIFTTLESLADLYLKKASLMENEGDTQQSEHFKNQAVEYLKQALEVVDTRFPADSPHRESIELKLKNLEGAY